MLPIQLVVSMIFQCGGMTKNHCTKRKLIWGNYANRRSSYNLGSPLFYTPIFSSNLNSAENPAHMIVSWKKLLKITLLVWIVVAATPEVKLQQLLHADTSEPIRDLFSRYIPKKLNRARLTQFLNVNGIQEFTLSKVKLPKNKVTRLAYYV